MANVMINDEHLYNIANTIRRHIGIENINNPTFKPRELVSRVDSMSSSISKVTGIIWEGTNVGKETFRHYHNLKTLHCPNVTSVKEYDFQFVGDYFALDSVDFPSATTIGQYAFYGCSSLTDVNFPSATTIGEHAFSTCSSLTDVNFPLVTSIYSYAFIHCGSLINANFPSATDIGVVAFLDCDSLTNINLPSITRVGGNALYGCGLTKIDLPLVNHIDIQAFGYCTKLTSVILRNNEVVELPFTDSFQNTPIESGTGYIYVPSSLVDSYKSATNWSTYADQIRAIEDYPEITGG